MDRLAWACFALAAVVVMVLALANHASAELLINPGFESAIGSEWTVTVVSGTFGISNRDAASLHAGSYGAHLQISGAGAGHAYFEQLLTGLAPGASYTITGWMRHVWDRTDKYHVYIEALGGGAAQSSGYSTTTYTQYTLTQTANSSGQIQVRLHLDKYTTTSVDKVCDAHFDDISVVPVGGTVPNAPTAGTATAVGSDQIAWGWTRATGASGEVYRAYDAATGGTAKWTSGSQATSYTESGLSANTLYGTGAASGNQRHLATVQGYESDTRLALPAEYTLASAPAYDDTSPYDAVSVRCDAGQSKTDCTSGQSITFTYNNAFGSGSANASKLSYKWDTSGTWDGTSGTDWTTGATLTKQAGGNPSSYYLHLRSWNSDSPAAVNTNTLTLGPYSVGGGGPILPALCVKHHSGGTFDGQTWATAFDNVQEAINASTAGDEIWVASGTYKETLVLPEGIALYGGFAGTETAKSQRNWTSNLSILDGDGAGAVIEVPANATAATRIDGFTITNGSAICGGGVFCNRGASPVIVNNIIEGNFANFEGGGVYCSAASAPVIANNVIANNAAATGGGGICNTTGSPTIANNFITGNSARVGGGICSGDTSTATAEVIRNNTIVSNSAPSGGGINCKDLSSATISNNIVAFNSSGIRAAAGTGTPVLKKNCVYGNDNYNYSGLTAGSTDISSNPQLASVTYGNAHINSSSPCKNAGDNTQVVGGYPDIDNQTRIQNTTVDIGADESDGTTWSVTGAIVRVSPGGSDSNNGSTWALAKRTIQAAVNAAAATGGEVWAKSGTYSENVVLRDYVYVYGGFAGTETARTQRNWTANISLIDGMAAGSAVTARFMGYRTSALDGFKLQNGKSWNGAGFFCSDASPYIMNNTLTANTALGNGAGIYLANSTAQVKANQITDNTSLGYGGGVNLHYTKAEVSRNNIQNNSAWMNGCGAFSSSGDNATLVNNRIVKNHQNSSMGGAFGSALSVDSYANPTLICNTIADNGGGTWSIYAGVYGRLSMYSNIVSFNTSGIHADSFATISQVASWTGDPLFVNRSGGNYTLQSNSPCIDVADVATAPAEDYLGNARPVDGDGDTIAVADIGCYEYGTAAPEPPVAPTSAYATPSSICSGASTMLHADGGSGTTLRWLTGGCSGTSVGTGNDLAVSPTSTTTYYARWETSLGNSTCVTATVTITGTGPTATVGGPQTISALGTTTGLGGNTVTPPATGQWSVVSGGTGTFSSVTDPNATFTHTGGDGPIVLRWSVSSAPCAPASADVTVTIGYYCLQNGNFDGSFTDGVGTGWTKLTPASGSWAAQTTIKHSGVASQKITDVSGQPAYTTWIYQTVSVRAGHAYVPTMWVYRVNSCVLRVGVDPDGGTAISGHDKIPDSNQWVYISSDPYIAGAGGQMTIALAAGYQTDSGTAYFDDVALKPQEPQTSGGTATINAGESATITAGGGFAGDANELCWYTQPNGGGLLYGTGTTLVVSPTTTTTFYPRWQTGEECGTSDDGAAVTITVVSGPPTVSGITPTSGANVGAISVTDLSGAGFISGASVKLTRAGCGDIDATAVVVANFGKITCSLDLTGRQPGLWNVMVINPDGQYDELANSFGIGIDDASPVVGATIRSLLDAVAAPASGNYQFRVWGIVQTINSSTFQLDDGSGSTIVVFAPGYTLADGDFASAAGTVDLSGASPVLVSSSGDVAKYN